MVPPCARSARGLHPRPTFTFRTRPPLHHLRRHHAGRIYSPNHANRSDGHVRCGWKLEFHDTSEARLRAPTSSDTGIVVVRPKTRGGARREAFVARSATARAGRCLAKPGRLRLDGLRLPWPVAAAPRRRPRIGARHCRSLGRRRACSATPAGPVPMTVASAARRRPDHGLEPARGFRAARHDCTRKMVPSAVPPEGSLPGFPEPTRPMFSTAGFVAGAEPQRAQQNLGAC